MQNTHKVMFKKCLFFFIATLIFINKTDAQDKNEIIINSIKAFGGIDLINSLKTWKKIYNVKETKILNTSNIYDTLIKIDTSFMVITMLQQKGCCQRTDFKHIRKNRPRNIFVVHNGEERVNGINDDIIKEPEIYDTEQSLIFDIPMGYLLLGNYELKDSASIDGEKCKILKVNGEEESEIWISEINFLIKRIVTKGNKGNFHAVRNFHDYGYFNGLALPKKIVKEVIFDDQRTVTISELKSYEPNLSFPKSIFFLN